MAAISVTQVSLLGTESRASNSRARASLISSKDVQIIPFKVSSGDSGTTGTDTFTVALDPRTTHVQLSIKSTTGTITRSNWVSRAADTVGFPVPPIVAGGAYISPLVPVLGGETLVLTTGTLATAASTVVLHEFAPRGLTTQYAV